MKFTDLQYSRPVATYQGIPIDAIGSLGDKLQTAYYTNRQAQDKLESTIENLNVRDVNRKYVEDALGAAKTSVENYNNFRNWEDAENVVRENIKRFESDKLVKGSLQDKALYDTWTKDLEERYAKGEIMKEQYDGAKYLAALQNTESIQYDSRTATYSNMFTGYKPVDYVNIQKEMFEYGEKIKASKVPLPINYVDEKGNKVSANVKYDEVNKVYHVYDANGYITSGEKKFLTENEVRSALSAAVMADPRYKQYIDEGIMLTMAQQYGLASNGKPLGANSKEVTMDDLFSSDPAKAALMPIGQEAAKKLLEEAGWDWEKIKSDPLMRIGLLKSLLTEKAVKQYTNAPTIAYSFEETEYKYLTDHVMIEGIKHRNEMAKAAYEWQNKWAMQKDQQAFERSLIEPKVMVDNKTTVNANDTEFNVQKERKNLNDKKAQKAKLERELAENKKNGKGNYNEIENQIRQLETEINATESYINDIHDEYFNTPEGKKFLDEQYVAVAGKNGDQFYDYTTKKYRKITKEEFKKWLKESEEADYGFIEGFMDNFNTSHKAYQKDAKYQYQRNIQKRVDDGLAPGFVGDVFTGEKGSGIDNVNQAITSHMLKNSTHFVSYNGTITLQAWIDNLAKSKNATLKDGVPEGITITSSIMDTDGKKNKNMVYVTAVDKATGKVIASTAFTSHDSDNFRYEFHQAGVAIVKDAQTDEMRMKGYKLLANANLPGFDIPSLEKQVSGAVGSTSLPGKSASSKPFNAGPYSMRTTAKKLPVYDDKGNRVGYNTFYLVEQIDPNSIGRDKDPVVVGHSVNPRAIENEEYRNAITIINDPNKFNKLTPQEQSYYEHTVYSNIGYASLTDAKVGTYMNIYGDAAAKDQYRTTGGSKSSTTAVKTSEKTKK